MSDKPGITTLEQLAEVRRVQARDQAHLLDHVQRAVREPRHGQGRRAGQGRRDRPVDPDDRPRAAPHDAGDAAGVVLRQGRSSAASSATSARTRPTSSSSSPARRERDVVASQVGNVHHPQYPTFEDFGDVDAARRPRHRLHPRRLVHARRPRDLGRRPADDSRHRRLHRDPQERRHRRTPGGSHLFLVDQKETRYIDCSDVALPVRRAARRRRRSTAPRRRCRRRTASWPPS